MSFEAIEGALRTNVTHAARLVLFVLAHRHNAKTGLICPSIADIVEKTRLSRASVIVAIANLERAGLLTRPGRKNGCRNRYTLTLPKEGDATVATSAESAPVQNLDRSKDWTGPVQNLDRTRLESRPVTKRELKPNSRAESQKALTAQDKFNLGKLRDQRQAEYDKVKNWRAYELEGRGYAKDYPAKLRAEIDELNAKLAGGLL